MVSSQSSMTAWIRTFGFSPVALMPPICYGPMSPELQYAMPLLLVPIQIVELGITVFLHASFKRYSSPSKYELDMVSMVYMRSQEQISMLDEQKWYQPYLQYLSTLIRYRLWPELTVSTVVRTLFLIVSAALTSVMVTCVSWFDCTADRVMGGSLIPGSVVYVFPAISCHSTEYVGGSWVMGGCIALWVVIIALTTGWVAKHRQQLAVLQARSILERDVPSDRVVDAWISLGLRPEVQLKKISHLESRLIQLLDFRWYWPRPAASGEWDEPVCQSGLDSIHMETREEYAFRSIYGALYDSFGSEAIGWILVMWIRRVVLIMLSVILTKLPTGKYMSFVMLHLGIFCLQIYYQPYRTRVLNKAEQVSIMVHVVIATILTAYPKPTDDGIQSIVLTITLAPLVTYVVYWQGQRCLVKGRQYRPKVKVDEVLGAPLLSLEQLEFDDIKQSSNRSDSHLTS